MPALLLVLALIAAAPAHAQPPADADYAPHATHGDIVVQDFVFHTGEHLPELRLHYVTWGTPRRGADGEIANAVLLLHGTLGDGVGRGRPVYSIFLSTPSMWQQRLPTREAAARYVREGRGPIGWPDANDFIYMCS